MSFKYDIGGNGRTEPSFAEKRNKVSDKTEKCETCMYT